MKKINYAALVMPALLQSTVAERTVELIEGLTSDTNNQLRLAMYLNGTLEKPTDFKQELTGDDFTRNISSDTDYRNRKAVFVEYNFIENVVTYDVVGGEMRRYFRNQEAADAWLNGGSYSDSSWQKSNTYPIECWGPCKPNTGCRMNGDAWLKKYPLGA